MKTLKEMIETEHTFEPYDFDTTEISGVKVHTKHFPAAPCIHVRILFTYGAMHDEVGKEGTAHFLEHMLFKGNDLYPDEKSIQDFKKDILINSLNAHTGFCELVVKGRFLPHNYEKAFQGIFELILTPTLSDESCEQERKIITEEAWGHFLNETYMAYVKRFRVNRLANLPNRVRAVRPLGWPDTVQNITRGDILDAHGKYIVKENTEIFIAGNIQALGTKDDLEKILSPYIEKIPNGEKATLPHIPETIDEAKDHRMDHTYTEIGLNEGTQAGLSLIYTFPRLGKLPGKPNSAEENALIATGIIAARLVGDITHEKLRIEQSWCYSCGASSSLDTDTLSFTIGTKMNPGHTEEAISIIENILQEILDGKYKEKFEQRRRLVVEAALAGEETTANAVDEVLDNVVVVNEIVTERFALERLAEVEFEDVQNMIRTYLTKRNQVIEIIRPSKK